MCDYCLKQINNKLLGCVEFPDDSKLMAQISFQRFNIWSTLEIVYKNNMEYKVKSIGINYCPICGRKLSEN